MKMGTEINALSSFFPASLRSRFRLSARDAAFWQLYTTAQRILAVGVICGQQKTARKSVRLCRLCVVHCPLYSLRTCADSLDEMEERCDDANEERITEIVID
jgi:hypothetical protein